MTKPVVSTALPPASVTENWADRTELVADLQREICRDSKTKQKCVFDIESLVAEAYPPGLTKEQITGLALDSVINGTKSGWRYTIVAEEAGTRTMIHSISGDGYVEDKMCDKQSKEIVVNLEVRLYQKTARERLFSYSSAEALGCQVVSRQSEAEIRHQVLEQEQLPEN